MRQRLHILIGGSDKQNGDFSLVRRLAYIGGNANWGCLKTVKPGDPVLIYIRQPPGAFVTEAKVMANPKKGKPGDYPYRAKVGKFKLLPNQLGIRELKSEFPHWSWLRYPRRGTVVPENLVDRLWHLVHEKQSHVQIIISNSRYGLQQIEKLNKSDKSVYWAAPKNTQAGDSILFYVERPVSAIIAKGKALSGTRPSKDKRWYEARIGKIEKLRSPISLQELRQIFPEWAWLKHVVMFCYVSPKRAKVLQERCKLLSSEVEHDKITNVVKTSHGAGFGNAETNRLVEKAACRAVNNYYKKNGYKVISREKENLGYDFDVIKGQRTIHLEVKGVSGAFIQFLITQNEVHRAQTDTKFKLAVVTMAKSRQKKISIINNRKFRNSFHLKSLTYMASEKEDIRA